MMWKKRTFFFRNVRFKSTEDHTADILLQAVLMNPERDFNLELSIDNSFCCVSVATFQS